VDVRGGGEEKKPLTSLSSNQTATNVVKFGREMEGGRATQKALTVRRPQKTADEW